MKEYVAVPAALLMKTKELSQYFQLSVEYARGLKPKPTTRKKPSSPIGRFVTVDTAAAASEAMSTPGARHAALRAAGPDTCFDVVELTAEAGRTELVEHLTAGVDWIRIVERMTAAGVTTAGPAASSGATSYAWPGRPSASSTRTASWVTSQTTLASTLS